MTNAEAIEHLKDILDDVPNDKCIDWIEALNKAIEVLEQEPCEDCVSREAVEDAIAEYGVGVYGERLGYSVACEILSEVPFVTPQFKEEKENKEDIEL